MKYVDMHCDTLMEAYFGDKETLYEIPSAMVDLKRMKNGDTLIQFFAIFPPDLGAWEWFKREPLRDEKYVEALESIFNRTMKEHSDIIRQVKTAKDLEENKKAGVMSALLTMEDGKLVNGEMEKLEDLYEKGYREIGLTWNFYNCFGAPNSLDPKIMNDGLTAFGKEAVERMNELGMIVDVSHLSDGGFYDVAEISKKPFIASHSDCRSVCNHPRNLTDDMIRILAEKGGVAGLNFNPPFLNATPDNEDSRIEDMVKHVLHLMKVGGEDCVGIGTDFDGVEGNLEIDNPTKMHLLFEALKKEGVTESQIEKMAYKNVERVIKDVL